LWLAPNLLVWCLQDALGNLQTTPTQLDVATLADSTPPVWAATPTVSNMQDEGFDVSGSVDEASTMWMVVVPRSAVAPSSANVVAGEAGDGGSPLFSGSVELPTPSTAGTVSVVGLTAETDYDVYVVANDATANNNLQASPVKLETRTVGDATPPEVSSAVLSNVLDTSFDVATQLTEAGTVFVVVLDNGAAEPTAAQVVAGTDSSDTAAPASGQVSFTSAAAVISISSYVVAASEYVDA